MNKQEIVKLIALCSVNYRNFPEEGKEQLLVELWHSMLSDVEFNIAEYAIKKHISLSHYAPTIADIREHISSIIKPKIATNLEAWGDVTRVIRKYGSYREADAMNELQGITKKVVQYIGYRDLCISENVMADRAHFLKTYDSIAERQKEEYALNSDIAVQIEIQKNRMIGAIEDGQNN